MRRGRNHKPYADGRARDAGAATAGAQRREVAGDARQQKSAQHESAQRERAQHVGAQREPARREAVQSDSPRRDSPEHESQLYGVLPVLEALRAGSRSFVRITLAEGAHEHRLRELLELAQRANVPVRRAPRAELQRIAAGANHQGVIAAIAAARYAEAGELLDALEARKGTDDLPLALVLDGVEDPRNLGAIIRTAECAGAHGVFVPERRAVGLTETVAKASAGALEYVPVARVGNVAQLIEDLKARNIWTVGTAADATLDYTDWDWTQPSALVLGGEGAGLRRLVRERCDALVRIPLRGRISSLNVSVAAAVLLYEALRQRKSRG